MSTASVQSVRDHRTFLGQPVGLFVLFFTETWERFSYFGMRALLVLYMTKSLIDRAEDGTVFGFAALRAVLEGAFGPLEPQPLASQIYGLYTALVYLTPFFGGLIADRYWGQRRSVVVGAVLMAVGHFLMAFESLFLAALLVLIVGSGFFKPNISTQVGSLYPDGDPRRDGAFTIFYMGVNLGAFFAPLVCGTLGQVYGWHYGFGAAGVGMVLGLLIYLWGRKFLAADPVRPARGEPRERRPLTKGEWKAVAGLIVICFLNIVFWGVYEQQGNTIQLFADESTDWTVFGWSMPTTWFQSLNPLFIFILSPLLIMFWNRQAKRGRQPGSVTKMSIGCGLLGLSFLALMLVGDLAPGQKISFLWLVFGTFIYTLGELYLSPVGLSLFSKAAPPQIMGMMMGVYYLSSFFGNYMSGWLGMFYSSMTKPSFFLMLAALACAAGTAIFALRKPLRSAIGHEV